MKQPKLKPLAASILSLSLLTVMAGAAVAPALEVIRAHFSDASRTSVQLIVSMPAVFIVITNLCFNRLAEKFGSKTLIMTGLVLYTAGGCCAGLFDSIGLVLLMRALVGVGVGMIMPLSTGLLTYYFPPEKREGLLGLASAANQLGGVIATLLAGLLAGISWRLSFMVYLMGLISIVLCLIFLPNDRIGGTAQPDEAPRGCVFRRNLTHIAAMFLLMSAFFVYPANFAIVTAAEGDIPMQLCAPVMAGLDLIAFLGGLLFVWVKRVSGRFAALVAPLMFLVGYCLLAFVGGLRKRGQARRNDRHAAAVGVDVSRAVREPVSAVGSRSLSRRRRAASVLPRRRSQRPALPRLPPQLPLRQCARSPRGAMRLEIVPIHLLRQLGYESAEETVATGAVRLRISPILLLRQHGYYSAD